MQKSKTIMGMPVVINVVEKKVTDEDFSEIFSYLHHIDNKFSTYKKDSEISKINRDEIDSSQYSFEMKEILSLSQKTNMETNGYFDISINGVLDPSGIVKGYAIWEAAKKLKSKGFQNFYIEIAGDIQVFGRNKRGDYWKIGIQNPFNPQQIIKVVTLKDKGIATSGTYIRGMHIFNPREKRAADEIKSITVIGPNIFEADRFATAAFAMGEKGIEFIESLSGFEGYVIQNDKKAVYTSGFKKYII